MALSFFLKQSNHYLFTINIFYNILFKTSIKISAITVVVEPYKIFFILSLIKKKD